MILVCGEALMDVFAQEQTATGTLLDARVGGSPFNVAIGLARLHQPAALLAALSNDLLGQRLLHTLDEEGVQTHLVQRVNAPTTLSLVGLDAQGVPSYAFYGHGGADRQLQFPSIGPLGPDVSAIHLGSYAMVVEPVAHAQRRLVERECAARLISYDPNLRLNVEPDLARWQHAVSWMTERAHLIKVSAEDLQLLHPATSHEAIAADWLNRGVALVVVTRGPEGAQAFTRSHCVEVAANPVQVIDTVGAGDTFQAALLTWLAENGLLTPEAVRRLTQDDLHSALAFASRAAALTCSRRGADLPRRAELDVGSTFSKVQK